MASSSQQGSSAQHPSNGAPNNHQLATSPPPSKQSLGHWWKTFTKANKKEEESKGLAIPPPAAIFGAPLQESIKFANVAISLTDTEGKTFIYGYVPIVVAKCGVFLKEKAVDVEGIFRLSGSARRIKELQTLFDSPDRYGKGLDWTGFTVHDAANIFRRYLNMLPEPIIPYEFYEKFRDPLRHHQREAVGNPDADDVGGFDDEDTIRQYQILITHIPPLNRQLLLYVLDLLAVFASKSDINLMPSANLAAIFQPGMLSHKKHDLAPQEYRLSQDILIYLIENQDHFLIGMKGTAADSKTVAEVQQGGTPPATTPRPTSHGNSVSGLGRSSSNASAGAESLRRFGGVRRNVSVSSKHSSGAPSPVAASGGGGGIHRSNTLPSKKSPAIPSSQRFGGNEATTPLTPVNTAITHEEGAGFIGQPSSLANAHSSNESKGVEVTRSDAAQASQSLTAQQNSSPRANERLQVETAEASKEHNATTPAKEGRGLGGLFSSKSPTSDTEKKDQKHPNKLRKKRMPGSANMSAHSSTNSLHGAQIPTESSPTSHLASGATLVPPSSQQLDGSTELEAPTIPAAEQEKALTASPTTSVRSKASATEHRADPEHSNNLSTSNETGGESRKRLSQTLFGQPKRGSSPNNNNGGGLVVGRYRAANASNDSLKGQSYPGATRSRQASAEGGSELANTSTTASVSSEHEKRGPINWIKNKMRESKEERVRAKSPPPVHSGGRTASKQSLSAVAETAVLPTTTTEGEASKTILPEPTSTLAVAPAPITNEIIPETAEPTQSTPLQSEAEASTATTKDKL